MESEKIYNKWMFLPDVPDKSLIGRKVQRSSKWIYGNQDGGNGNIGIVIDTNPYSYKVKWPNGYIVAYPGNSLVFADNSENINDGQSLTDQVILKLQQYIPGYKPDCYLVSLVESDNYKIYDGSSLHGSFEKALSDIENNRKTMWLTLSSTPFYPFELKAFSTMEECEEFIKSKKEKLDLSKKDIEIQKIEKELQKFIPGYTYACEVECVKLPFIKGTLKIGTRFKTNTNIDDLKYVVNKFAEGAASSAIAPDNKFGANFEKDTLVAVNYISKNDNSKKENFDDLKSINYNLLSLEDCEKIIAKHFIPGFYIGCTLEIVQDLKYPNAKKGNRFSTSGLKLSRLQTAIKDWSGFYTVPCESCAIDPENTFSANYLYSDLKVVDTTVSDKETVEEISVSPIQTTTESEDSVINELKNYIPGISRKGYLLVVNKELKYLYGNNWLIESLPNNYLYVALTEVKTKNESSYFSYGSYPFKPEDLKYFKTKDECIEFLQLEKEGLPKKDLNPESQEKSTNIPKNSKDPFYIEIADCQLLKTDKKKQIKI